MFFCRFFASTLEFLRIQLNKKVSGKNPINRHWTQPVTFASPKITVLLLHDDCLLRNKSKNKKYFERYVPSPSFYKLKWIKRLAENAEKSAKRGKKQSKAKQNQNRYVKLWILLHCTWTYKNGRMKDQTNVKKSYKSNNRSTTVQISKSGRKIWTKKQENPTSTFIACKNQKATVKNANTHSTHIYTCSTRHINDTAIQTTCK